MMRARVNLITADPDRMADTIGYIKTSVRPAVESMDGSLGLSLYANAKIGETMWVSQQALAASRGEAAAVRVETVQSTGAVIRAVEEYDLVFSTARIGGV
jgi:hypothetical protein